MGKELLFEGPLFLWFIGREFYCFYEIIMKNFCQRVGNGLYLRDQPAYSYQIQGIKVKAQDSAPDTSFRRAKQHFTLRKFNLRKKENDYDGNHCNFLYRAMHA